MINVTSCIATIIACCVALFIVPSATQQVDELSIATRKGTRHSRLHLKST